MYVIVPRKHRWGGGMFSERFNSVAYQTCTKQGDLTLFPAGLGQLANTFSKLKYSSSS